jgi:hypothetical protein
MRNYNLDWKDKYEMLHKKTLNEAPVIPETGEEIIVDSRTKKGKRKPGTSLEVKPSYISHKNALESSTIDTYIAKANIIQKI